MHARMTNKLPPLHTIKHRRQNPLVMTISGQRKSCYIQIFYSRASNQLFLVTTDQKVISTISHATLYKINANRTEMKSPQKVNSHCKNHISKKKSHWIPLPFCLGVQLHMRSGLKGSRYAKIVHKNDSLVKYSYSNDLQS